MILVRHGESEFNVRFAKTRTDPGLRDPGLTARGRAQITAAAGFIADLPESERPVRIVSSPYTRALQSAEILAGRLALPIEIDVRVREHAHFTCDIGTARSALARAWPAIAFDHLEEEEWWPDHEDAESVSRRAAGFRGFVADLPDWPRTLVVSHWGFIRGLTRLEVPNAAVIRFDPTAPHPRGGTLLHPAPAPGALL